MKTTVALIFASIISSFGIEWKKLEIDGVEYVSLEQVGEFYHLKVADAVTLKNRELTLEFEKGSKNCSFNEVNFELTHPLVAKGGAFYLATIDLAQILEPILRPSEVDGLGDFDTVILDLVIEDEIERKKLRGSLGDILLKRGFKVVDPKPDEKAVEEEAVYLQIVVEKGEERSLRTSVIGKERKAGMSIATGLHWPLIQDGRLDLQDLRIALSDGNDLKNLAHPGVRLALMLDSGGLSREFCSQMGKSVANALYFAKKAGAKPKVAVKEEK